ncbi:metallophosphoesterase family protein [Ferrovum sp. PN-J185]|uniref:metallophosphoesterase family protein n=1 Tax=Ferrovum sp. PN-J185 TaxID=1356306 RepID=UPI0007946D65|nr:metallophosphoesterase [Ferrovum sp. PN-J185]KXW55854.1 calcineurin-like phosphoesterase [Ferrovum sp. PN-J185]
MVNRQIVTFILMVLCVALTLSSAQAKNLYSYVVVGPDNTQIIRVIVDDNHCPTLYSKDKAYGMTLRVASDANHDNPSYFPVAVCELVKPINITELTLDNQPLPLLPAHINKIAVIGDTGCRIKAPFSYQGCNDPQAWPLQTVARSIASEKPDVLIHVGDYLYRESRCITQGCQGSVHGYGWESWQEDVFKPMREMMLTTPMVFVRGNHESCHRAGQGWFRFLDPYPYNPQHACVKPNAVDMDQPYSIIVNPSLQWIVFDSAEIQELHPTAHFEDFVRSMNRVGELLQPQYHHWLLLHHPSLGYAYSHILGWNGGTTEIYNALLQAKPKLMDQFDLFIQGHIHTFAISNYRESGLPLNIVSGMGGTSLEDRFPAKNLTGYAVQNTAHISKEVNDQHFGFLVYSEVSGQSMLNVKDTEGHNRMTCQIHISTRDFTCQPHD